MEKKIKFVSKDKQLVEVEIEVRTKQCEARDWEDLHIVENPVCLSIRGKCGNGSGQINGDFEPTEAQKRLCEIWDEYHLNDLVAGTRKQMEALKGLDCSLDHAQYDNECEFLSKQGLLYDRGFKYGTGWLFKEFPMDELEAAIKSIEDENERIAKSESETNTEHDIYADEIDDSLLSEIEDIVGTNCDAEAVIALLRRLGLNFSDAKNVVAGGLPCEIEIYGRNYLVGTYNQLSDFADEYEKDEFVEFWKDDVASGNTMEGFDDWWDNYLNNGLESILDRYDGQFDFETVNGTEYCIAEE